MPQALVLFTLHQRLRLFAFAIPLWPVLPLPTTMRIQGAHILSPGADTMGSSLSKQSRRDFLRTSSSLALGLLAANYLRGDDPKGDFGDFTVGTQSYTFRNFNLEQALKRTQDLGLKHIEFYNGHVKTDSSPEQIAAVKKLCSEYGITPVAFGVEHFSKDHDANKKLFGFGQELGIKHLSADPDPDSFDSLDKLCEEYKICIAIHPHGPAGGGKLHRWYCSEVILAAIKDHNPLIGTCLDTGHLIRSAQLGKMLDPAAEVRAMGSRNFGIHLKDHDNEKKTDVVYGKGALNVAEVLKALREVKFKGYISIEYEANPQDPSPDVKACVAILKNEIQKLG
jgi:sugar phosphate isomerase/epimerase